MDWAARFGDAEAVWRAEGGDRPHVKTSLSGKHVDAYFNSDMVVSCPDMLQEVVRSVLVPAIAAVGRRPDWVVSYLPFGLFLAYACANELGCRCAYADPEIEYDTYFDVAERALVLVVADDLYSGGSAVATIRSLERRGTHVLPMVFCLANLSGESNLGGRKVVSAMSLNASQYSSDACPLCDSGSEALAPRPNWGLLRSGSAPSDQEGPIEKLT